MTKKIFLIVGEPSGDVLGAGLMREIKKQYDEPLEFVGIGGPLMEAQGMTSLLPMDELCVMGIWEIVWQLPRLIKLINGVVEEVEAANPDVLVTIDLPDFNFEVVRRLRKRENIKTKMVHYVAPSVWAWRPGRAKKIAALYDKILCLLPFEPPYFTKHNTKAEFVGHPLVEEAIEFNPHKFRSDNNISMEDLTLGVFFGSRERELLTHAPIFKEVVGVLKEQYPDLKIIIPTLPDFEFDVRNAIEKWEHETIVVSAPDLKWDSFAACDVALAVSGTVALELAYVGVPHAIAYKTDPFTAAIVKALAKVKFVHLANILFDKEVVPEFLQGKCESLLIAKEMLRLFKHEEKRREQMEEMRRLSDMLKPQNTTPSQKAATEVLRLIAS